MSRHIVTAGQGFTDIDAYASAIAYAQLKRLEGVAAEVVLPGPLNVSVPPQLRPEQLDYEVEYVPRDGDTFVVLDVSEPDHIATFVRPEGIEIIIDHHFGYEEYWRERGVQAQIEHIGAVCTQVFELWEQAGRVAEMPQRTAMLLAAGILDNTLNFSSAVTEPRDHHAYGQLLLRAGLDESFSQVYFEACQKDAERDIKDAIMGDSKKVMIPGFVGRVIVGQLALWDVRSAFDVAKELCDEWSDKSQLHMVNLIAINERKSYIVTCDTRMRKFLEGILDIQLTGVVTATDRLWLRKEILKAAMDRSGEELS